MNRDFLLSTISLIFSVIPSSLEMGKKRRNGNFVTRTRSVGIGMFRRLALSLPNANKGSKIRSGFIWCA
jgi:hypothetical protein